MEELVRLRVGGSRGPLGFRRLEQSADGGRRNSRSGSCDSASARMGTRSCTPFVRGRQSRLFLCFAVRGNCKFELHALSRGIAGRDKGGLAKFRRHCGCDTFPRLRLFCAGRDEWNHLDRRPRSIRDGPGRLDVALARRSERAHALTCTEHDRSRLVGVRARRLGHLRSTHGFIVFASWIFYALNTFSLFYFRRKLPAPAYRTPAFPWPPVIFIACSILLIVNTLWTRPKESLAGLGLIAAGIPVYFSSALPLSDRRKIDR